MVNFFCIPGKSERVLLDSNRAKVAAVGGELDEEVGNGAPETRDHSASWFSLFFLSSTPLSQKEKLFHEQKRALVACNASVKHANLQFFLISQYIVSCSSLYRNILFPSDSKKTCLGRSGKDPTRSCLSLSNHH